MRTLHGCTLIIALFLGCGGSRSSSELRFPGDPKDAIAAVQAEIAARGFKPKCKERAYCVFEVEPGLEVHLKVAKDRLLLPVDVDDAEKLGPAREAELRRKGEALGQEIWAKAAPRAEEQARGAKAQAEREEAEESAREAAEARREGASGPKNTAASDRLREMMQDVQGRTQTGAGAPASTPSSGVSVETRCCVNGRFLDCPVSQCADLGQCLYDCVSKGASGCEEPCYRQHASSCKRVQSRDAECAR
jgi:hypothetical protein